MAIGSFFSIMMREEGGPMPVENLAEALHHWLLRVRAGSADEDSLRAFSH
jgi:hypothetical protein